MCSIIWNIIQCTISRITWCALSFEILYNVQFHVLDVLYHLKYYTMYNFTYNLMCSIIESFEILYNVQFHV